MSRITHKDLVKLTRELNELLGKSTDTGGYFLPGKKHQDNPERAYKPDVPNTIKLYHGGVPGYTLYDVHENGGIQSSPLMDGVLMSRLSTREMYNFLVGVIAGIKAGREKL
jgi:hypothetical protein